MFSKLYKKIFACVLVMAMAASIIPAGAIEKAIESKSDNAVNNTKQTIVGNSKTKPLTYDDFAIMKGWVPRGEILSETIKKQELINKARQDNKDVDTQPTLKEMILYFKKTISNKYEIEQKNENDAQSDSISSSLDKYQINQQDLDSIDTQRKAKKVSVDETKASDTLKKLSFASETIELPKLDKEQTKKILENPDKLDLLTEHNLLSKVLKVDYTLDEITSDQDEHDEYDAKYYSDRLDKLISKYLSSSKISEQEAIEALKKEYISAFNIETFSWNGFLKDTKTNESTEQQMDSNQIAPKETNTATIDYTAGLNKYFANNGALAFDPGSRASVNPATGALQYNSTDISLKGKNGLDLNISTMFDSNKARLYDKQFKGQGSGSYYDPDLGTTIYYTYPIYQYNDYTEEEIRNEIGTGWSFGFPFIEKTTNGGTDYLRYLHMGDGTVYQLNGTTIVDYNKTDMTLSGGAGGYTLSFADGRVMTFDDGGKISQISDRFGNSITFTYAANGSVGSRTRYVLSQITDSMGRVISFTYSGGFYDTNRQVIISYLGENSQQNTVTYDLQAIPNSNAYSNVCNTIGFNTFITALHSTDVNNYNGYNHYKLVKKTDQMGRETNFNYSSGNTLDIVYFHDYSKYAFEYRDSNTHNGHTAPLGYKSSANLQLTMSSIQYPTGGSTQFTYGSLYKSSSTRGSEYAYKGRVVSTTDYDKNNVASNTITYQYYNDYTDYTNDCAGFPNVDIQVNYQPQTSYNYSSSKITADNTAMVTQFNGNNFTYQMQKDSANNLLSYTEYNEFNSAHQPGRVDYFEQSLSGTSFTKTEYRDYDAKGNITADYSIKGTGRSDLEHKTSYTYNSSYNYLTGKTYKTDSATTVTEEYVPTTDNKSVAFANVYVNSVLKKKTGYTYDTYGNVTESRQYKDDFTNYITTQYDYTNSSRPLQNGGYLRSVKTIGVHDVDGGNVTTPNETTGTVVNKFDYDLLGNLIQTTDANGNITTYQYDKLKRATRVDLPDGKYVTCSYNDTNNTQTFTNEIGTVLVYAYDNFGRLVNVKDNQTSQNLATYVYDTMGRLSQENNHNTSSNSYQNEYTYDIRGLVSGVVTKDKSNNVIAQKNIINDIWYSDLDGECYIVTATKTVGDSNAPGVTQILYSTIDKEVHEIENAILTGLGSYCYSKNTLNISSSTYDYIGRKATELSPRYYEDGGSGYSQGYTSKYVYDYAGNIIKQYDASGNYATFTYNALGQKVSEADMNAVAASRPYSKVYTYDELGRVIKTETPLESNATSITKVYYDPNGNVTSNRVTNNQVGASESYKRTDYHYNSRNMLTQVAQYNGSTADSYSAYYYDGAGNILRMYTGLSEPITITGLDQYTPSNASCSVTKYAYDRFGNVTSIINPLNQTQTFQYDLNKNLTSSTDANSNVTSYTYDGLSRLLSKNITASSGNLSQTQTYTKTGQINTIANSNLSTTYTYDNLDRVIQAVQNNGVTKAYTYDANGNRKSFVATVGGVQKINTTYDYDILNRLTAVKENGTQVAGYTYDANGNRTALSYSNGNSTQYTYNNANMIKTLTNKQGTTTLSSYSYDYYLDGNQKSKTEGTGKVTNYTYDNFGRLSNESITLSGATDSYGYTYDHSGNRSTMTASGTENYTTAYSYNAANRLLKVTKTTTTADEVTDYFYDNNGNQISKRKSTIAASQDNESVSIQDAASQDSLIEQYEYNALNQLTKSTVNGVTAQYTYQPDGLRYSKTVGSTVTRFTWDGDQLALETNSSNAVQAKYVRGINCLYRENSSGTRQYYLYNGHGDVVQLGNSSGAVTKTYVYDAFGNEKNIDSNDTNPMRYCGEYFDKETGTIYLRARYYDAGIGRFISEDKHWNIHNMIYGDNLKNKVPLLLAIKQSNNLYVYGINNPVIYKDKNGNIVYGLGVEAQAAAGLGVYGNIGVYIDDNYNFMIGYTVGGQIQFGASASVSLFAFLNPNADTVDDIIGWNLNAIVEAGEGLTVSGALGMDVNSANIQLEGGVAKTGVGVSLTGVTYSNRYGYTGSIYKGSLLDVLGMSEGSSSVFIYNDDTVVMTRTQTGISISYGNTIINIKNTNDKIEMSVVNN